MQASLAQDARDVPGPSRPRLSTVFPESTHVDQHGELDSDQTLSVALGLSFSPSPRLAFSESSPSALFLGSPVASPLPADDVPDVDLASSPAAMFLSAFSPATSEQSLAPDDEGAVVSGYTLGPIVGHGGFSIIRTACSPQGGTVAVKIVRHSDLDKQSDPALARKSLEREADAWSSLNHEHILPLFTVTHTPYADFFFTAYCPAGSLFDILKRDGRPALPQDDAGMMFRQVVRGLRYMHEVAGYVHGDLKLENVLVDEMGVCKIGDFGMARKIGEVLDDVESDDDEAHEKNKTPHRSRTISQANLSHRSLGRQAKLPHALSLMRRHGVPSRHRTSSPYPASGTPPTLPNRGFAPGSLPYAAPELLLPPSNAAPYVADPAQDIWALGVMLYTLLTGKLPFSDSFEPRLQMKILHGVFEMPQGIGRSAEQVLRGCIERSVPNRWTVAMVDEVAWGIGWGSAADDVTPPPEAAAALGASRPSSRSRVKARQDTAVDEKSRSASRVARSSGCAMSAVRSASRSKSRPPHHPYEHGQHHHHHPLLHTGSHSAHPPRMQPSLSSLTNAILRTSSAMSSSDSSSPHSSAIILQPSLSSDSEIVYEREHERGRLPRPRMHADVSVSRSRSPHEMPVTPRDMSLDVGVRRHKSPPSRPTLSTPELDHSSSELDRLDEDARWQFSPSVDDESAAARSLSRFRCDDSSGSRSSSARGRAFSRSRDEFRKAIRNESMPPVLSPSHSSAWALPPLEKAYTTGRTTGVVAPATPIPIPGGSKSARSKSLDPTYTSRRAK